MTRIQGADRRGAEGQSSSVVGYKLKPPVPLLYDRFRSITRRSFGGFQVGAALPSARLRATRLMVTLRYQLSSSPPCTGTDPNVVSPRDLPPRARGRAENNSGTVSQSPSNPYLIVMVPDLAARRRGSDSENPARSDGPPRPPGRASGARWQPRAKATGGAWPRGRRRRCLQDGAAGSARSLAGV